MFYIWYLNIYMLGASVLVDSAGHIEVMELTIH